MILECTFIKNICVFMIIRTVNISPEAVNSNNYDRWYINVIKHSPLTMQGFLFPIVVVIIKCLVMHM